MQNDYSSERREPLEDESTTELVREFVEEGKRLMREEARLVRLEMQTLVDEGRQRLERDVASAKEEIKEEARKAARAGGAIGAGGILGHAALYLVLFTVVFGLSEVMPLWAASLIVALVVGGAAAFLIYGGIERLKSVHLSPRKTLHHLQEDKQWMKDRAHALRSTIRANA
jgi:hypothetical protein